MGARLELFLPVRRDVGPLKADRGWAIILRFSVPLSPPAFPNVSFLRLSPEMLPRVAPDLSWVHLITASAPRRRGLSRLGAPGLCPVGLAVMSESPSSLTVLKDRKRRQAVRGFGLGKAEGLGH